MPKYEVLRAGTHAHLRVVHTDKVDTVVDSVMVVPKELWLVHREFPIFFRKHPETGRFFPNALFAFHKGENYFVNEQGLWLGDYCPLSLRLGPFMVSAQLATSGEKPQRFVAVNMADSRVSSTGPEGEALFDHEGAPTPYMNSITNTLHYLHEGTNELTRMMDLYTEFDLIEPVNLKVVLKDKQVVELSGAYTINEDALLNLDGDKLAILNQAGFLAPAFYVVASIANVQRLINRHNLINSKS